MSTRAIVTMIEEFIRPSIIICSSHPPRCFSSASPWILKGNKDINPVKVINQGATTETIHAQIFLGSHCFGKKMGVVAEGLNRVGDLETI
jgi:hypothetical protein